MDKYINWFTGLGCYSGTYYINLKADSEPRGVLPALYQPQKAKLKDMEERSVIAPFDEPTDWVNSLVITEKKEWLLRLCLDPNELNKNICCEQL